MRSPPILAHLNRSMRRRTNLGVACEVVGENRLFYPYEVFTLERPTAGQCFRYRQGLVVVNHHPEIISTRAARGADDLCVTGDLGIAYLELYGVEAQRDGLGGVAGGPLD